MNKKEFINQVSSFLASSDDIIDEKDTVIINIANTSIDIKLKIHDDGELYCSENGQSEIKAQDWIIQRLAKLDILANAILDKIEENKYYVEIPCTISSLDKDEQLDSTLSSLTQLIDDKNHEHSFVTNVFYLTAEAGEGKTCILEQLSRQQALRFKSKQSSWLLLLIPLGGRPFLRLDEIIVGTLTNYYRFNSYYIESCIELIKQGRIVLALDGFEEMFISGEEGNVISSLGNLFDRLNSTGKIIFSTRKAYYQYTKLENQAKLYDSFRNRDVEFTVISLEKWKKEQFCNLMKLYEFDDTLCENIYLKLSMALNPQHPILTRAVLTNKLVKELYENHGNVDEIVNNFKNGDESDVVTRFIEMLLNREVKKWVSRDEIASPLLSVEQHEKILILIADEMWHLKTESLKQDILLTLTEIACSDEKISPTYVSQCKERIIHHALLSPIGKERTNTTYYSFCHEDFYYFFLGKVVAYTILDSSSTDYQIKNILDKKVLPEIAINETIRIIKNSKKQNQCISKLNSFTNSIIKNSCLSLNISSLLLRIYSNCIDKTYEIKNVFCSINSIYKLKLCNIHFLNCLIEKIELDSNLLQNITFTECDILEAIIPPNNGKISIIFDEKSLPAKLDIYHKHDELIPIYDPNKIKLYLYPKDSITTNENEQNDLDLQNSEDEEITLFYKLVNYFLQNTAINENVLKVKMGTKFTFFDEKILQPLVIKKILIEDDYKGKGKQKRYKLNCTISYINEIRKKCNGKFDIFLNLLNEYLLTE